MPHEDKEENAVDEVVEEAGKAVDVLLESDPPPPLHGGSRPKWTDKAKGIAALTTAVAALLASFGAFAQTCDHSVTESAYNALSANITKLADQEQKNQQDIAQLRGYLDGITHAPILTTKPQEDSEKLSVLPAPPGTGPNHKTPTLPPQIKVSPTAAVTPGDAGVITFAIVPPAVSLPPPRAPEAPVKPPSFEKAVESK